MSFSVFTLADCQLFAPVFCSFFCFCFCFPLALSWFYNFGYALQYFFLIDLFVLVLLRGLQWFLMRTLVKVWNLAWIVESTDLTLKSSSDVFLAVLPLVNYLTSLYLNHIICKKKYGLWSLNFRVPVRLYSMRKGTQHLVLSFVK